MKMFSKVAFVLLLLPSTLAAQPGVRMSADFLPLSVGNRWVYDVFNEGGQKVGTLDFAIQEYRILSGRSFYLVTNFPFVADDAGATKLIRYNREERQYMRMVNNEESPLFLADGAKAEVIQADASGLPQKFVFTVINTSGKLLPMTFKSGQTYDFEVTDALTGQEVWRWSRRMFFTQVIRQEAIRGNRNWVFEVTWNHRDNDLNVVMPGKYKVIASLATQPPIESDAVIFEVK